MVNLLLGLLIGYLLRTLQWLADDYGRAKDIYHDQPWMVGRFSKFCWYWFSNPLRPLLRLIRNFVLGIRCKSCGSILPGDAHSDFEEKCPECYWGKLLSQARHQRSK